jgi:hypothetical protein
MKIKASGLEFCPEAFYVPSTAQNIPRIMDKKPIPVIFDQETTFFGQVRGRR